MKAAGQGGLRSGPAANKDWQVAYHYIQNGNIREGVSHLAQVRAGWLTKPALLVRAARHYEGAFQIQVLSALLSI